MLYRAIPSVVRGIYQIVTSDTGGVDRIVLQVVTPPRALPTAAEMAFADRVAALLAGAMSLGDEVGEGLALLERVVDQHGAGFGE